LRAYDGFEVPENLRLWVEVKTGLTLDEGADQRTGLPGVALLAAAQ
jgi:hypothetical protein